MNQGRFFMPNMAINPMMIRNPNTLPNSIGMLQRITNSIRSFNWSKLLNGANKTLNVMNQAIPLIRQTKPIISNVRSMVNIAKAFKNETNNHYNHNKINNKTNTNIEDEYPTFFV